MLRHLAETLLKDKWTDPHIINIIMKTVMYDEKEPFIGIEALLKEAKMINWE